VELQLAGAAGADVSLPTDAPISANKRVAQRLLRSKKVQAAAQVTRQRQKDQLELLKQEAIKSLSGGSPEDLAQFLSQTQGVDIEEARKTAKKTQQIGVANVRDLEAQPQIKTAFGSRKIDSAIDTGPGGLFPKTIVLSGEQFAKIEALFRSLNRRPSDDSSGRPPGEPGATNIFPNGRFVYPDAATQRRNTVNGQSTARDMERIA